MKMRTPRLSSLLSALILLLFSGGAEHAALAQSGRAHKTENVVVVMLDGLRWQEVFQGADAQLLANSASDPLDDAQERAAEARRQFWAETPAERRQALMPFLWSVMAAEGQIFGNRTLGSDSHVINGLNFSYPGYSETLTGIADPRIHSNDDLPNPNRTVFEWLNSKPEFQGKVAAFGAWEVFNGIFNRERCGFVVNAGYDPLTAIPTTPELAQLNRLKEESARLWPDEPFDPLPFHTAIEYVKAVRPRLLFVGLGETDEWAHSGSYAEYLRAAHRDDGYLRELWTLLQSMPEYHERTTLIVLADHGRGNGGSWTSHGEKIPESMQTWMAFLGPDTPAFGERRHAAAVTDSQIAATVAAFFGEDYRAAVPNAGLPIQDVMEKVEQAKN